MDQAYQLGAVHFGNMLLHDRFIKPIFVCIEVEPEAGIFLSKRISSLPAYFRDNLYSSGIFHRKFYIYFCWDHAMGLDPPLKNRSVQTDPLNLTFALIGVSSVIYLAISGSRYAQVDLTSYKAILIVILLVTAFFGMFRKIVLSEKFDVIFSRIQFLPWLVWCLVFIPTASAAHLIAPALLVTTMLVSRYTPWNQLRLPENDILGSRAVKIVATLETTLLIFLSALLAVMDLSLKDQGTTLVTARDAAFIFFALSQPYSITKSPRS